MRRMLHLWATLIASSVSVGAEAHQASSTWAYPPACCKGSEVGGDCHRLPGSNVKKGPDGFSVLVNPGDHPLVTKPHRFLIPYGQEIPSGDRDFHICLHPTEDHMNCFFAPPDGV
ncbi:hypothetical protein CFBP6624_24715 (plasmid) [Agrobacterium tumefaciens]|uniref:Uncharacterized protein n=1 Tax=Agrobacterium tumefaciens TaxID=358 RepID=A0AAE6BTT0_AGRTU|nr:hypothetical protein F9K79_15805 [Ochrobactrum sp. Kaboul]QCM03434.1 hypothetical protein CFBP6624_24715 [Agrobacterium tumefaciens]TQN59252.1 hypothetical protein FLX27_23045 [Agrobacterium tumefaciens]